MDKRTARAINVSPADYRLDEDQLANNPNIRLPIVICVDTSYSMRWSSRLDEAVKGLRTFYNNMCSSYYARDSVEVCIISYGGKQAKIEQEFRSMEQTHFDDLKLEADGETPLIDAVNLALDVLEERKGRYKDNGNTWYRPWLLFIGDGDETEAPTLVARTAAKLKEECARKHLNVLCVTVGNKNSLQYSTLKNLSPENKVYYLPDMNFTDFFQWLSRSIERTSQSLQSEEIQLEPTTGWGEILRMEK